MMGKLLRNRNQVFSRFLPGSVMSIDGETVEVKRHSVVGAGGDPNSEAYIRRLLIGELGKWPYRDPAYRTLMSSPDTLDFELVKTEKVQAYPVKLYECKECRAVQEAGEGAQRGSCHRCGKDLRVLPFLLIHTCGKMKPLRVPDCEKDKKDFMKLERFGKQRWVCGICGNSENVFNGYCGSGCELVLQRAPLTKNDKILLRRNVSDPGVHNSQILTLLNPPGREVAELLKDFEVQSKSLFLADYFGILPAFAEKPSQVIEALRDLTMSRPQSGNNESKLAKELKNMGLSEDKIAKILKAAQEEGVSTNPRLARAKELEETLQRATEAVDPAGIDGIEPDFHRQVRDNILARRLDGVLSLVDLEVDLQNNMGPRSVYIHRVQEAKALSVNTGLEEILYVPNLPILSVSYGFTRVKNRPDDTVLLKAFPNITSTRGSAHSVTPLFVEGANTEALMFCLSSRRMIAWLVSNGWVSETEAKDLNSEQKRKSWFLQRQQTISFDTIPEQVPPVSWAIAACVHSISHLLMGQIASLSSFGETSLSEMLFPATLSTVIFVNQRSEFSLGGLRTFLEQRLNTALLAALDDEGCMLDPGCGDDGGACVGCLYIPEVSCRLLNTALSRHLLFGGPATGDLAKVKKKDIVGYFQAQTITTEKKLFK